MASSRKPRSKTEAREPLLDALHEAVAAAVAPVAPRAPLIERPRRSRPAPLLIALSGGRDSVALLDAALRLRAARAPHFAQLRAVHVNHGLQQAAVQFEAHCVALCERMAVPLDVRRTAVQRRGRGVEAAAREARYAALAQAARDCGARLVLTAHHLDDRIETFLIQWLRGAGPEGLAAFPPLRGFEQDLLLLRPWSEVARAEIHRYVARCGLKYVEDPTNADPTLLRNALRVDVIPVLERLRPGFARAVVRSVDLVAETAAALIDVAEHDLAYCTDGAAAGTLRLDRLALLAPPRRALALRRWLAAPGREAPSRARLQQVLHQALHARADAKLLVRLGDRELRRYRGLLMLRATSVAERDETPIQWNGEEDIAVPAWRGVLRFVATEGAGFDPDWLRAAPLALRARGGGERFKPHPTRPSRSLKREFQDAGIAEFERAALPLVWRGDELIYVAGLGADVRLIDADGPRVRLEWVPDAGLLDRA
ncbi:MAG: tRNA lysidine(34) synthetase TilS [Betaproteobacteria bacterium]